MSRLAWQFVLEVVGIFMVCAIVSYAYGAAYCL